MITPSTIYWLTRCDAIKALTTGLAFVSAALAVFVFVASKMSEEMSEEETTKNPFGRGFYKTALAIFITALLGSTFLPSTKEMAAIIVIPRIANAKNVQQLGEGIVTLAQDWLRELSPKKGETE